MPSENPENQHEQMTEEQRVEAVRNLMQEIRRMLEIVETKLHQAARSPYIDSRRLRMVMHVAHSGMKMMLGQIRLATRAVTERVELGSDILLTQVNPATATLILEADPDGKTVQWLLKYLALLKGLNISEIADKVGVSLSNISNLKNRGPISRWKEGVGGKLLAYVKGTYEELMRAEANYQPPKDED